MNSAIRAVFKEGVKQNFTVLGIFHGYRGLIEGNIREMNHSDVENIMHKGGTILRTARSEEFKSRRDRSARFRLQRHMESRE